MAFLEVCQCIEEKCLCDKTRPWYYQKPDHSGMVECPCRSTRIKIERIDQILKNSNIPPRFLYRRLHEFNIQGTDEVSSSHLAIAVDEARHFLENYGSAPHAELRGLYLFGPPGTGKTMLACIILNELVLKYAADVGYIKITRDFFNRIRASFNTESLSYGKGEDIFHQLARKEVLAIDDFGVQADSEWEKRTLYDLIDARYENQTPTIITSNIEPEAWRDLFQGRILSRLKEMTGFYPMVAEDYRSHLSNN